MDDTYDQMNGMIDRLSKSMSGQTLLAQLCLIRKLIERLKTEYDRLLSGIERSTEFIDRLTKCMIGQGL